MQVFVWIHFLLSDWYLQVELPGHSMFNFLRNYQTVFQSCCTILYSCHQWARFPAVPHPNQHLMDSVFWILTILIIVNLHFSHNPWGAAFFHRPVICMSSLICHIFVATYFNTFFPFLLSLSLWSMDYLEVYCSVLA